MCQIFACLSSPAHQKDETLNSTAAGANETKQGDNVSVTDDANNNQLGQPSADQPKTSGLALASLPAQCTQALILELGEKSMTRQREDFSGSEQQYKNQKRRFSKVF